MSLWLRWANQRTSGPVNAHLTFGPGIYFNVFIHVYSHRARTDNPLGKMLMSTESPYAKKKYILKWFKNALIFICVFFRFEGKIVKLKIIKFFSLVIRSAFAANWIDLPVMCKFLGKNGKITILGIKLSRKIFFTRFQFTCDNLMHQTKNSIKKFEFLWKRDFYTSLKI